MAQIIRIDGSREDISPKGRYFNAEELQEFLNGTIQIVNLSGKMSLVIDADGLAKELPANDYAITLFNASIFPKKGYIVGDVILCRTNQIRLDYNPESDVKLNKNAPMKK